MHADVARIGTVRCRIVGHAKCLVAIPSPPLTCARGHRVTRARHISWLPLPLLSPDEMCNNNSFSILPIASHTRTHRSLSSCATSRSLFLVAFNQSHYIKIVKRYRFETISNFISSFQTRRGSKFNKMPAKCTAQLVE